MLLKASMHTFTDYLEIIRFNLDQIFVLKVWENKLLKILVHSQSLQAAGKIQTLLVHGGIVSETLGNLYR